MAPSSKSIQQAKLNGVLISIIEASKLELEMQKIL
jgi:hypothetical protein